MESMSCVFSFTFFHCRSLSHCIWLVAISISHFVTASTKFWCCSSPKKVFPFFFISRSRSLSPFVSLSVAGLPPTFSFSLSFLCLDSLTVSALQDAGGYTISRRNSLELHFGCYTCWLSYFTLICLWCCMAGGRSDGRASIRSRDYQISSDG